MCFALGLWFSSNSSPPDYDSLVSVQGPVVWIEAKTFSGGTGAFWEIVVKDKSSIEVVRLKKNTKYRIPKVEVGDHILAKVALDLRKVSWWVWELNVQGGESLGYEVFAEMSQHLVPELTFLVFTTSFLILIVGVCQLRKENSA